MKNKTLQFMKMTLCSNILILVVIISIFSLATNGLKLGLDFTGGTLVEVKYDQPVDLSHIRKTLDTSNFKNALVINYGSEEDILVRLPQSATSTLGDEILSVLKQKYSGDIDLKRIEYVGPQIGEELREQGGLGLLIALISVMVYVTFRFQYKFRLVQLLR